MPRLESRKIAVTHSIFDIEGSSFGLSHLFVCSTNAILQLRLYDQFVKNNFLVPPSEGGWGKNFKFKICQKFSFLIFRKSQEVSIQEVKLLRSNNRSPNTVALSPPPLGSNRVNLNILTPGNGSALKTFLVLTLIIK